MSVSAQTNLFTTSVSWGGKETLEAFLKPYYVGLNPLATPGIRVIPDVPGKLNLNIFDVNGKKTKAYAAGFNGVTGDTYTQKTLTVNDMKAEAAFSNNELKGTIFRIAMQKGYAQNDITDTVLEDIYMEIWMRAVQADLFRQVWLGDTAKTTVSTYFTATADTDYNAYTGIFETLVDAAATTAVSPTGTHIYRKAMDHGAVAQVNTITITTVGSAGGNLVIAVNGVNYTQVYASSMNATAAAFVASHAATILAKHRITVTNPSGAGIVFTSAVAGMAFTTTVPSASAVTASGGVVATTANTAPSAMADDEALTYLEDLYINSYPELVALPASEKVYYVDMKVYHNYMESLEDSGTYTEIAKDILINGRPTLTYRGVPVIPFDWNSHIAADFPANYYDEGRIIYTAKDNIVIGIDGNSNLLETDMWYEKLYEQNFFRTRYSIGVQYYSNKLTSVSY